MSLPALTTVDRFLQPLLGTTLLLGLVLLWQGTYDRSCVALASPGLVYVAIIYGLLEYRLERKRFAVDYYLDRRSSWRRRLRGTWLPVVISMVAALPLAVFLVVFAALSRPTDWLFLAAAAVVAPFLFDRISRWPGRHFRRDAGVGDRGIAVADILSVRLAGWVLLAVIAVAYVYFNYMVIGGPPYIYPDSLQLTVEAFTSGVQSACPVVDDGLRAAAALEGSSWYVVTRAATASWTPDGIRVVVWIGFFLNVALAIAGFVRGIEGCMLAAWRIGARNREAPPESERRGTDVEQASE